METTTTKRQHSSRRMIYYPVVMLVVSHLLLLILLQLPTASNAAAATDDHDAPSSSCRDLRPNCKEWAAAGQCEEDPVWMLPHCPRACNRCQLPQRVVRPLDENDPQLQSFGPHTIVPADVRYPLLDAVRSEYGVPQVIWEHDREDEMRDRLFQADRYMQDTVLIDPTYRAVRDTCRLRSNACAHWAVQGECETASAFMSKECGPICQSCQELHVESRCPIDPNEKNAWYPGDVNRMFERIVSDRSFVEAYDITILSRPSYVDGDTAANATYQLGPWVVTLDNFLSPLEADTLIDVGAQVGYAHSIEVGPLNPDGTSGVVVTKQRTSMNAWCNTPVCMNDLTANAVYDRMQNVTHIKRDNSEALQLLRYEPGQFYKIHHDFIDFETQRRQGPRVLTVFLYLNDVEQGGGTNFPRLDLTVEPKKGRALLWPSVLDEFPNVIDGRTHHQALVVEKGIKYGCNAWLHQRAFHEGCT